MTDIEIVNAALSELEKAENFRIVCAVECYSRAWGIYCPDSDYHVFIGVVRSPAEYQVKKKVPKILHYKVGDRGKVHVQAWDFHHVIKAFDKHNPTIFEWVNSPIVYRTSDVWERLRELSKYFYGQKTVACHHLFAAATMYHNKLKPGNDGAEICPWLYIPTLRDLLCSGYVLKNNKLAPIPYEELFKKALPKRKKLQEAVYGMIESNRVERLPALSAPEPTIQAFIKEEKKRLKPLVTSLPDDQLSSPNLENFFVQALMECWR